MIKELLESKLIKGTVLEGNKRKYSIQTKIGGGDFAFTYKAEALDLREMVCLKVLYKAENEESIERFREEGKILSLVCKTKPCPYIVEFIDLFSHEINYEKNNIQNLEIYVLVMEFVNGKTLSDYVSTGRALSQTEADLYFEHIATALDRMHQLDIIHRDAHPSNIVILQDNEQKKAVLIDFGLSGNINPEIKTTRHFANRCFAPPEQAQGIRSVMVDVYTLTASLYYAITQEHPPEAKKRVSYLENKKSDPLISDIQVKQEELKRLRSRIQKVIKKGMSVSPKKRYQSIKDWLEEFKNETKPSIWEKISEYFDFAD